MTVSTPQPNPEQLSLKEWIQNYEKVNPNSFPRISGGVSDAVDLKIDGNKAIFWRKPDNEFFIYYLIEKSPIEVVAIIINGDNLDESFFEKIVSSLKFIISKDTASYVTN